MRLVALALCLFASPALAAGRSFTVTPVITADAYAQADQIGTLTKLEGILECSSCPIRLETMLVLDKSKTKDAFDVYFFSRAATLTSIDNGAFDVADTGMATSFAGKVSVAAADFSDTNVNSTATKALALMLPGTSGSDLWMALVCTDAGGCDWGAIGDLTLRLVYDELD